MKIMNQIALKTFTTATVFAVANAASNPYVDVFAALAGSAG